MPRRSIGRPEPRLLARGGGAALAVFRLLRLAEADSRHRLHAEALARVDVFHRGHALAALPLELRHPQVGDLLLIALSLLLRVVHSLPRVMALLPRALRGFRERRRALRLRAAGRAVPEGRRGQVPG